MLSRPPSPGDFSFSVQREVWAAKARIGNPPSLIFETAPIRVSNPRAPIRLIELAFSERLADCFLQHATDIVVFAGFFQDSPQVLFDLAHGSGQMLEFWLDVYERDQRLCRILAVISLTKPGNRSIGTNRVAVSASGAVFRDPLRMLESGYPSCRGILWSRRAAFPGR